MKNILRILAIISIITIGVTGPFPSTPQVHAALDTSLTSCWKFDESSGSAADSKGPNTLTNNNSTVFVAAKINNGADFESTNLNYFDISDAAQTGLDPTDEMSVSFWIKPETTAGVGTSWSLVNKGTVVNRQYAINIEDFGAGVNRLAWTSWNNDTNDRGTYTFTQGFTAATWYHVVMTRSVSGAVVHAYINGVEISSTSTTAIQTIADGAGGFQVGSQFQQLVNLYDGVMDELGIWARVLSQAEVTQLYNSGNAIGCNFASATTYRRKIIED